MSHDRGETKVPEDLSIMEARLERYNSVVRHLGRKTLT